MKKSIIFMLFALFSLSCSNEDIQEQNQTLYDSETPSSIDITTKGGINGGSISFGIGRTSRDCRGLSICRINSVTVTIDSYNITWTNQNKSLVEDYAIVDGNYHVIDENNFYLLFDDSIIDELVSIQGDYHFVMEESFTIDIESAEIMGVSEYFTISESTMPIIYDSALDLYKVLLTNSND